MAASRLLTRRQPNLYATSVPHRSDPYLRRQPRIPAPCRTFSSSTQRYQQQRRKETFRARLGTALRNTKTEWYWIPATAGIAFVGGLQSYRMYSTAKAKQEEEDDASTYSDEYEQEPGKKPKKRKRIKPSGPWYISTVAI
jgi:phosphatidylserine decarboxylase